MAKKKEFRVRGEIAVKQKIYFPVTMTIKATSRKEAEKQLEKLLSDSVSIDPATIDLDNDDFYLALDKCQPHIVREAIDEGEFDDPFFVSEELEETN